jgi:hypothetical protein
MVPRSSMSSFTCSQQHQQQQQQQQQHQTLSWLHVLDEYG